MFALVGEPRNVAADVLSAECSLKVFFPQKRQSDELQEITC